MLDAMGISQHHDAITGTALPPVIEDYLSIIAEAKEANSQYYAKLIDKKLERETGYHSISESWMQCAQTNRTYLECPVASQKDNEQFSMAVAVHNPGSLDAHAIKVLVPRGTYQVDQYIADEFVTIGSDLQCFNDYDDSEQELKFVESCHLNVLTNIQAKEISLFNITRVSKEWN